MHTTDTATPATTPATPNTLVETIPAKRPVASIRLYRAEGPTAELDRERTVTVTGRAAWLSARSVLLRWGTTAPRGGAYDKVDFEVTWEGGDTYNGCFDLHREGPFNVGEHIRQFQEVYGGLRKPAHMTPEQYAAFLDACTTPAARAACCALLDSYDLG